MPKHLTRKVSLRQSLKPAKRVSKKVLRARALKLAQGHLKEDTARIEKRTRLFCAQPNRHTHDELVNVLRLYQTSWIALHAL